MAGLSESRSKVIGLLVRAAPDHALYSLNSALAACAHEQSAMADVQALVAREASDRRVRDAALAPVTPLFGARAEAAGAAGFPPPVLRLVWDGVKRVIPEVVAIAASPATWDENQSEITAAQDQICSRAGVELRIADEPEFQAAAEALARHGPGERDRLCLHLELCPIARRALAQLHEWLGR